MFDSLFMITILFVHLFVKTSLFGRQRIGHISF